MGTAKILMPYNFHVHEHQALDFIINNFANREEVRITLFSTYVPLPEFDFSGSPELGKVKPGMIFLSQELERKKEGLMTLKKHLEQNGFSSGQVDYIFRRREKDVADEIIDTARGGQYNIIVIRPIPGKIRRMFAPSVHEKVSRALTNATVCIVR